MHDAEEELAVRAVAIFAGAQVVPAESREVWVREECGADAVLRTIVFEFLKDGELARELRGTTAGCPPSYVDLQERYRIIREIGRGGMGCVYLAYDTSLHRDVAVKQKLSSGSPLSEAEHAQFWGESRIAAKLEHPGLVPIHDAFVTRDRDAFLVMRFIHGGRTLGDMLGEPGARDGETATVKAIGVALKVCEALAYVHSKGYVHRDVKPANIMVGPFGEVYLLDWGIAASANHVSVVDVGGTVGGLAGTQRYMAPELRNKEVHSIGFPVDIYAIGVVLREILNWSAVLGPADQGSGSTRYRLVRHRGRRGIAAAPELHAIVGRATAEHPSDRYPSVVQLGEDIQSFLEGGVVAAYPTSAIAGVYRWIRRHRGAALAVAGLLLSVFCFATISLMLKAQADRARDDVLRLSAREEVLDLRSELYSIWPPHPDVLPALNEWIGSARQLVDRRPEFERDRNRLLGEMSDELDPDKLQLASWMVAELSGLLSDLATLELHLNDSEMVFTDGDGWSARKRQVFAELLRQESAPDGSHGRLWADANKAIKSQYGLVVKPLMGVVPIGVDPVSKLWEFAFLPSGDAPKRRGDGRLEWDSSSAAIFVLIPGGTFMMGAQADDPDADYYLEIARPDIEGPVHEVQLTAFAISKYELTQGQWRRLTGENDSAKAHGERGSRPDVHPVENQSWTEFQGAFGRFGLSLPTEAQWEYAALAGSQDAWWFGADKLDMRGNGNIADLSARRAENSWGSIEDWIEDGYATHAPVHLFGANAFGLHGVHGNVWEWCRDFRAPYAYENARLVDPLNDFDAGPEGLSQVARGGGFMSNALFSSARFRSGGHPDTKSAATGARPVLSLECQSF